MTYWEQRAEEAAKRYEDFINKVIPEMTKAFESSKKTIQDTIYSFWGKYAKDNQISLAEAQKALSKTELAEFKSSLKEFEQLAKDSIGTFNLQLENMSVKARVSRLEALLMQIEARLQELYQNQRDIIKPTVEQVTLEAYYHGLYDISIDTKTLFAFAELPTSFIEQVLAEPVMGADISTRLWRHDIDTGFKIRQTLMEMFTTGKPPQYFAESLAKVIGAVQVGKDGRVTGGGKKYEAYRLLYNESSYCTGQARFKAYQDSGVSYYKIVATLDTKTSDECRSLDGCIFSMTKGGDVPEKYKKADSEFRRAAYDTDRVIVGTNYPPFHVNCRSVAVPYYETMNTTMQKRAARDKDGNPIKVPADMTYYQWYDEYIGKSGE